MLTVNDFYDYQKKAVNFQCSKQNSALWLDMGLGKTAITLTSINHLLNTGFLKGVLIVAPIRVVRLVWRQEAQKWSHTRNIRFSVITGNKDQRVRALVKDADVYLINYENLRWLSEVLDTYFIKKKKSIPFDGLVWDEISKMKNSATKRVRAIKKILPHLKWSTGLTGTPASNGYKDLHGQFLVLDKGHRLGTSKTAFKHKFYYKVGPYKEVPFEDTEDRIRELIGDITLEMSAEDYNPLPDIIYNDVEIELPDNLREMYDRMEKEFFLQLDSGSQVEMFNQASLTNKALQFSNGAMYPVAGMPLWEPIHDLKLDALEELIGSAAGKPILCSYAYRSDAERIMKRFKDIKPINLTACKSESQLNNAMSRWKSGDCQLMIGHAACLHPRTQVLTEKRGWVRIIDVNIEDRVFDGIEFVEHGGCTYSGVKEVIDIFGITLTPDHKLLIDDQWVEAHNVRDNKEFKRKALYQWKILEDGTGEMSTLRCGIKANKSECLQKQSIRERILQFLCKGQIPQYDRNKNLENLAGFEVEVKRSTRQELWWSWNNNFRKLGKVRELLQGHVTNILERFNNRKNRCERTLQQGKLRMGDIIPTTIEQAQQSMGGVQRGENTSCRISETEWFQQDHVINETQQGDEWGSGCGKLQKLKLRKEKVYDLVNCGPRHRFLIRNDNHEMFISHNSMGHGVDGLQNNGHILVWFGLTWSLDLYEQFNARIRRQGQGKPVICHRITTKDTLDQAQLLALQDKASTQEGLRSAIKQYRLLKEKE